MYRHYFVFVFAGELQEAIKKTELKFGLYVSLMEWFNPHYLHDLKNNFKTQTYINVWNIINTLLHPSKHINALKTSWRRLGLAVKHSRMFINILTHMFYKIILKMVRICSPKQRFKNIFKSLHNNRFKMFSLYQTKTFQLCFVFAGMPFLNTFLI